MARFSNGDTPRAPSIQEVADHPDDDGPRLVWAEATRGERGELVAVQCLLGSDALEPERRETLRTRERELLSAHGTRWSGLEGLARGWRFRRGFVDSATMDAATLIAHPGAILAAAPLLKRVTVTGLSDVSGPEGERRGPEPLAMLREVLESPVLEGIEGLELVHVGTDWERDSEFSNTGFDGLGDQAAALLAESPRLAALTALGLTSSRVGPLAARALAEVDLARIERLGLAGHELEDDAVLEVLRRLPRLVSLDLTGQNDTTRRHPTGHIAHALPASLAELHLGTNFLHDDDLRALADSPVARGLRHLSIGHGWYEANGLRELGRFGALHTLDLSGGSIGSPGHSSRQAEALRAVAELDVPSLRVLRLADAFIDEEGARTLVAAVGQRLEVLDLRHNWRLARIHAELARHLPNGCLLQTGDERTESPSSMFE